MENHPSQNGKRNSNLIVFNFLTKTSIKFLYFKRFQISDYFFFSVVNMTMTQLLQNDFKVNAKIIF